MSALHAEATARNIELQGRLAGLEEALHMHDCLVEQLEREKGVSAAHVDEKLALQERLQEMERQAVQPEELVADLRSQVCERRTCTGLLVTTTSKGLKKTKVIIFFFFLKKKESMLSGGEGSIPRIQLQGLLCSTFRALAPDVARGWVI